MVHDCYDVVDIPSPEEMVILLALIPLAKNLMINSDIDVQIQCGDMRQQLHRNSTPQNLPLTSQLTIVLTALQSSFNSKINITSAPLPSPSRGIMATANVDLETIKQLYVDYYDDHNFTFTSDEPIDTTHVINTNKCLLHMSKTGNTITITSAIDAILKGAAGNAIHAMNLLFGLHERTGLTLKAQVF